ncbi:MAG: hypothetical protein ACOYYS_24250 [Chloroflexota bacterium]
MKNKRTIPQSGDIACPRCGRHNPSWYASCEKCGARLTLTATGGPVPAAVGRLEKRPGCVTVYAALFGLTAALIIIVGLLYGFLSMSNRTMSVPMGFTYIVVSMLVGGFYYTLSDGLMKQRNWARLVVIAIQGLGIAVPLLAICWMVFVYGARDPLMQMLCNSFIGIPISAYILSWFVRNKRHFR